MEQGVCKICNSLELKKFISFGRMPVANAFIKKENVMEQEYSYNMEVGFCNNCKMVQLMEVVPYEKYIVPDKQGNTEYAFFSSTSSAMTEHFSEMAKEVEERFLNQDSKVLETGCNDGIMLQSFKNNSVLGVEPSTNVAKVAESKGIEVINDFFTETLANRISLEKGKFRAILSTNVTLNIINLHDYLKGVVNLLDNKGVFITEDPYILDILEKNSYDQIYDEHIWYFSLNSLSNLYEKHGLEIFDAERQGVHGGSMRVYACKKGAYEKTDRLKSYLEEEMAKGIDSLTPYTEFRERVEENKNRLVNLIQDLKSKGKKIVGYAAASKGTIVQNYCGLGTNSIDYISDSTEFKQGLYSPGMNIPIVSPEKFHQDKDVGYAILFAWNHAEEIMKKEKDFTNRGGKFIVHLPEPKILDFQESKEEDHSDTTQSSELIEGVEVKPLKVFANDQGYLFETIRSDDKFYGGEFGQILMSEIYPGVIKGFHLHEKHDEYTVCVKGNLKYVAVKEYPDGSKKINTFVIGEKNPVAIKVPRGVWHGYMPLESKSATLMYLMGRPFDPKDPDTQEKDVFHFGDVWTVKNG